VRDSDGQYSIFEAAGQGEGGAFRGARVGQEVFFFEKKNQKTFAYQEFGCASRHTAAPSVCFLWRCQAWHVAVASFLQKGRPQRLDFAGPVACGAGSAAKARW
jgi:hypothetical protein